MRVPEVATGIATEGDRFGSSSKPESTTKLWRLSPWYLNRLHRPETKLTYFSISYYRRGETTSLCPPCWRRGVTVWQRETSLLSKPEKHNLCLSISIFHHLHLHHVATERNDISLQSALLQTTMEPLSHGQFDLVPASHWPTGPDTSWGTLQLLELYWRHHYSLVYRNTPPDKDSLHDVDDMPCWLHSIEATNPAEKRRDKPIRKLATNTLAETDFASSLRIATRNRTLPTTTDINHQLFGNHQQQPSIYSGLLPLLCNSIHVQPSTPVQPPYRCEAAWQPPYRCEAAWQPTYRCQHHGSIFCTSNSVLCIHCFLQYTPNYWIF